MSLIDNGVAIVEQRYSPEGKARKGVG